MSEVITIQDLETLKKHEIFEAEVITGKVSGLAGGAYLAAATNPVTGQTQDTLPQILSDLGMQVQSWSSSTGGVLTTPAQIFLNDTPGSLGIGDYYAWAGPFPKTVPAGTDPALPGSGYILRSNKFIKSMILGALRHSYAEAGFVMVPGSFEIGGTLISAFSVLLHEGSGKAYSGVGPFPQTVPANTDPNTAGYQDRSDGSYRAVSVSTLGIKPNTPTDWSAAIQYAIDNISKVLYFPDGTYFAANLQLRSGCKLIAQSRSTVLKLPANAMTHSINGSLPDSNGRYPGNVIATTLNHDGGVYFDNGVRAKMLNNTFYIVTGAEVSGFTIDGNKAENTVGDVGLNASAMGAGINIALSKGVKIFNNRIINCRMDGVFVGYSLCGGSDDCDVMFNEFEGNQRTNIALITGQRNLFLGNTGGPSTGGPSTNAGPVFDLEPNLQGEVCANNTITGNIMQGGVAVVCALKAYLRNNKFSGNRWYGSAAVNPTEDTSGSSFVGDTFTAVDNTRPWITKTGPLTPTDSVITALSPVSFVGCTATGFDTVLHRLTQGQHENITIRGCTIGVKTIGQVIRGYKVHMIDNDIQMVGGSADAQSMIYSNSLGASIPFQGSNTFVGNRVNGISQANFVRTLRDATYTSTAETVVMSDNVFDVSGNTTFGNTSGDFRFVRNTVYNFKPFSIADVIMPFNISDNVMKSVSSTNMFTGQTAFINDSIISDNTLTKININLERPSGLSVERNKMVDGSISIVYSFTSAGVGGNSISFNYMKNRSKTLPSINATTGGSFLTADFWAHDNYKGNVIAGHSSGVTIQAELTSVSDVS